MTKDHKCIIAAFAEHGFELEVVNRIIKSHGGKSMIVLCWKTELSTRTALDVQQRLAPVLPRLKAFARIGENYLMTPTTTTRRRRCSLPDVLPFLFQR